MLNDLWNYAMVKDEHQEKVSESSIQNLEKKIYLLEKRMEPIEDVYFYTKDFVCASENFSQEGVFIEKRFEQLERKLKWLEKRMLGLECTCYSKAVKDVPSEEEVSAEEDDPNEVINVSCEEDEPAPKRSRPSTSIAASASKTSTARAPSTSKTVSQRNIAPSQAPSTLAPKTPMTGIIIGLRAPNAP
ncbi:hypothetical protein CTI12_AA141550 [Artemisia annua]|uniref:Uncharacterized protein n=1 Tax=Artemisia annua TaxID=35608 RepID=A0A2U1PKF7_ARTAN|nr:hypothetical protein CTI12_AA141550 [Artemisia annua]